MFYYVLDAEGYIMETGDGPDSLVIPSGATVVNDADIIRDIRSTENKMTLKFSKTTKKITVDLSRETLPGKD